MNPEKSNSITILENNGKVTIDLSEGLTFTTSLQMLLSAIRFLAKKTADIISKDLKKSKASKTHEEVCSDIADMINFGISNILEELSPKDPDLQLSEVAIATMENEIIQEAANRHLPMKKVLQEYESRVKHSPFYANPNSSTNKEEL